MREAITKQRLRVYRFDRHGQFIWDTKQKGFGVRTQSRSRRRAFVVRGYVHGHRDLERFHQFADLPWEQERIDDEVDLPALRREAADLQQRMIDGWDPKKTGLLNSDVPTLRLMWQARQMLESKKTNGALREATIKDTTHCLENYSADMLDVPLKSVTTPQVMKRAMQIANGAHVSPTTGNKIGTRNTCRSWLVYASAVFNGTKTLHELAQNPFAEVLENYKRPPTKNELSYDADPEGFVNGLTDEQIHDLLHTELESGNRVWQLCAQLQLFTGMRANEVTRLTWSNINDVKIQLRPDQTKAGRAHTIPITPESRAVLEELWQMRTSEPIFPGRNGFIHTSGMPAKKVALALGHSTTKCGKNGDFESPAWASHDLRRSWAAAAEELDIPEAIIGRVLNHSAKTVTRKAYAKAKYERVVSAVERVNAALMQK